MKDSKEELIHWNEKHIDVLISYIVAYRAFGLNKEQAILAMQELAKRKFVNPNLQFESKIEEELVKIKNIKI